MATSPSASSNAESAPRFDRAAVQQNTRRAAERFIAPFARTGITPNGLTVLGFLLNVLAGAVLAYGAFVLGGLLVLIGGAFDMFDGAMARATNRKTVFGEFLDSTMDRFSEAVVFLGLAVAYLLHEPLGWLDVAGVVMCFLVMIGSIMISYTRAKAEGLNLDCEVGWLQRPERIIAVGVGLLLYAVSPYIPLIVLAVLAVMTHFTVGQRVAHVRRLTATSSSS